MSKPTNTIRVELAETDILPLTNKMKEYRDALSSLQSAVATLENDVRKGWVDPENFQRVQRLEGECHNILRGSDSARGDYRVPYDQSVTSVLYAAFGRGTRG